MNTNLARWGVALLLSIVLPLPLYAEHTFRIDTDFPGGGAEILNVDPTTATVHIQPIVYWELGFPCWWYLQLSGLEPGREFTFKISANPRPYRPGAVLNRSWCQPGRMAISTDNVRWSQTDKYELQEDGTAVYVVEAPAERIWLAWGPPFLPSQAEDLVNRVAQACSSAEPFTLAQTRGDRPVPAIRIGGGTPEEPAKYGVWVQARQHAWETGSSWVAQGFLNWAAGDDPTAKELRRLATIWVVPIMDIDRVAVGAGGKDSIPRDHNRDWDDSPVYRAVAAAQSRLTELHQEDRLDVFLDIHNPGDDKRLHYFYGPNHWDRLPALTRRNHLRWLELAKRAIVEPLALEPEYQFITYIKTEAEANRVSANWVRNHTAPHVLSTTFEAASNTPHSTQVGYQAAGRQLAEALTQYLRENPRRKSQSGPAANNR